MYPLQLYYAIGMDLLVLNSKPSCLFCLLLHHSIVWCIGALPIHLDSYYGGDVEETFIPLFAQLVATISKTWWPAPGLQPNWKHTYFFRSLYDSRVLSLASTGLAYSTCLYMSIRSPWSYSDSSWACSKLSFITAYCHAQHSSSSCWTSFRFSRLFHHQSSLDLRHLLQERSLS